LSRDALRSPDPIIWAAVIAGGVSAIGNITTLVVARFGRDAQRHGPWKFGGHARQESARTAPREPT
jgi:hypothetical protein